VPVELQTGHLKVIDGQKKRDAEDQVKTEKNQLKRPPSWLIDDVAKKEWRRVVKELNKLNIVGNL
jgi:phage terminase small subunit